MIEKIVKDLANRCGLIQHVDDNFIIVDVIEDSGDSGCWTVAKIVGNKELKQISLSSCDGSLNVDVTMTEKIDEKAIADALYAMIQSIEI